MATPNVTFAGGPVVANFLPEKKEAAADLEGAKQEERERESKRERMRRRG